MDDIATPTQGIPGVPLPTASIPSSRRSSYSQGVPSAEVLQTGEMVDKLTLVDK